MDQVHFHLNGLQIPGLDRGHAPAVGLADRPRGVFHHLRRQPVAGESRDPLLPAGGNQNLVIGHVVVFIAVVLAHRADRPGKERILEGLSEQIQGRIYRLVGAERIQMDANLLPLLIVANGAVANSLGARPRNTVAAGDAVAEIARLAVLADTAARACQHFIVVHDSSYPFLPLARIRRSADSFAFCRNYMPAQLPNSARTPARKSLAPPLAG